MIDINLFAKSMKNKWIKNILLNDHANWKTHNSFRKTWKIFLGFFMNIVFLKPLPKTKCKLPSFYKSIIEVLIEFNRIAYKRKKMEPFPEIRKQILWGNHFIKHEGKGLVFKFWIES